MATLCDPQGRLADLLVDQVAVTLAERAGPMVEMRLTTDQDLHNPPRQTWQAAAVASWDVELVFERGPTVPLYLIGFVQETATASAAAPAVVAVALALPAAPKMIHE